MDSKLGLATLYQLHDIHQRILKGHTGGAKDFAERIGLPVTTFRHRLEALRSLGAEIEYDRILNTYSYLNDFEFVFKIKHN